MTALGLASWTRQIESQVESPLPIPAPPRYADTMAGKRAPGQPALDLASVTVPQPFTITSGQTLSSLLSELGLELPETNAAVAAIADHFDVRKLRAGEDGVAYLDGEGRLASLHLAIHGKGYVDLDRRGNGWESAWHAYQRETVVRRIEGELTDFLESDVRRAGGPSQLAYKMSDVLQWDLDFNRDLRLGDRFRVLYEEVYLEGELFEVGHVLAMEYENRDRHHEAYRYDSGYYDASGRPLQKMFLRSPLPFTRVTSRFTAKRFHPILKVNRPHWGVDYGAPTGTPVRVTASGVVVSAGRSGGAGKMVKVRHPNGYLTAYLHLSGYAPGISAGRRVRQGDVIGYVGATGLATAPHLDYRVQKNGHWIDPLGLTSQRAESIPPQHLAAYLVECQRLRAALGGDAPAYDPATTPPTRIAAETPADATGSAVPAAR